MKTSTSLLFLLSSLVVGTSVVAETGIWAQEEVGEEQFDISTHQPSFKQLPKDPKGSPKSGDPKKDPKKKAAVSSIETARRSLPRNNNIKGSVKLLPIETDDMPARQVPKDPKDPKKDDPKGSPKSKKESQRQLSKDPKDPKKDDPKGSPKSKKESRFSSPRQLSKDPKDPKKGDPKGDPKSKKESRFRQHSKDPKDPKKDDPKKDPKSKKESRFRQHSKDPKKGDPKKDPKSKKESRFAQLSPRQLSKDPKDPKKGDPKKDPKSKKESSFAAANAYRFNTARGTTSVKLYPVETTTTASNNNKTESNTATMNDSCSFQSGPVMGNTDTITSSVGMVAASG